MNDPLADGLCKQRPDITWFGETASQNRKAVEVCRSCPVSKPCCAEADKRREQWGVWGGVNRIAKSHVRREQRQIMEAIWAAAKPEPAQKQQKQPVTKLVQHGTRKVWDQGCRCNVCVMAFDPTYARRARAWEGWA